VKSRPHTSLAHVPGLDGLRGLAVIGVLLFHANGLLRGGYLGVDLFFVLSGFLITSLLVAEHKKTGAIDLRTFWVRRARRLLPALLSLMPAVALYGRTLAARDELAALRADALATLGYVANWRAIFARRSYWEMFTAPSPLEHTWSLAIEEQFYVVWPLVVMAVLVLARGRVRALLAVCVGLALASCAAMWLLYEPGGGTTRVYLGTDTRGASILAGAALASSGLAQRTGDRARTLDVIGVLAALGLGFAWWRLDGQSDFLYRGGFWLTELACLVLVLACVRSPGGLVGRALSLRPLRAMGLVSYGVYLWHWPIYVVLTEERLRFGGLGLLAVRLGVTLGVALVSYRFLERPIREHGLRLGRPAVVVPSAFVLAVLLVVTSTRTPQVAAAAPAIAADGPGLPPPAPSAATAPDAGPTPRSFPPMNVFPPASELGPSTLRVLVVGDSVGISLGNRMYWAQGVADAVIVQRAIGDCSILDGVVPVHSMGGWPHGNGNCARDWIADVRELRPDVTLVVVGGAFFSKVKAGGRWRTVCERPWHDAYTKELTRLLRAMAPEAGRRVVALAAYPVGKWQTPTLDDKVDCYNAMLREAAEASGAEVLDVASWLCPSRTCVVTSHEAPVRPDGLHFDGLGAEETARWVFGELRGDSADAGADAAADARDP
jgi:peptidoglycan/LPS O-acetylase OafA/YrhL